MTEGEEARAFEAALEALLDDVGHPDSYSQARGASGAASQVRLILEAALSQSDPDDWVPEPLRARYLTREEAERVVVRVKGEMLAACRCGDDGAHRLGALASTLARAGHELALPPLLQALSECWRTASAGDLSSVMSSLERVLWAVEPATPFVVEQLRAYPRLREWLRQIALRHLDATGVYGEDQLPSRIEDVDGYVATFLAPPELREIRRWTFALRRGMGGTWLEVVRVILRTAGYWIDSSVIAYEWDPREEQEVGLVLAPDERVYRLEINEDDEGVATRVVWTELDQAERARHLRGHESISAPDGVGWIV